MSDDRRRISVDLSGRTAIVTGASRGIGKGIATSLGAAGAKVACVARDGSKLNETAEAIRASGSEALVFECDVTDGGKVQSVVDAINDAWDGIDILVNNAGITRDTLIPRMSDDDWDLVIATNLRSVFLFSRAVVQPMMRKRYGRIINISSVSGLIGNPAQSNYSASKAGVIAFTRTIARELASRRRLITANVICPGFVATAMTDVLGDALLEEVKKRVPAQRLGEVDEIADAVLYLASDSASYVTGQVLTVDGGLTA